MDGRLQNTGGGCGLFGHGRRAGGSYILIYYLIIYKMTNQEQLKAILNTIGTINRYSDYLIEIKPIFDWKNQDLLKQLNLITRKDRKITWSRRIGNNGQTNKKIYDYMNNLYKSCCDLWLINFSK